MSINRVKYHCCLSCLLMVLLLLRTCSCVCPFSHCYIRTLYKSFNITILSSLLFHDTILLFHLLLLSPLKGWWPSALFSFHSNSFLNYSIHTDLWLFSQKENPKGVETMMVLLVSPTFPPSLGTRMLQGCSVLKLGCAVLSDSLWPHEPQPTRLLCPWKSPGKNTGVGCHALLRRIFPTQGLKPGLLHCRWILYHLRHQGSPSNRDNPEQTEMTGHPVSQVPSKYLLNECMIISRITFPAKLLFWCYRPISNCFMVNTT